MGKVRSGSIVDIAWARSIPEPNTGCWIWEGMSIGGKYAHIKTQRHRAAASEGRPQIQTVSRLICEEIHGALTNNEVARHTCDQPLCVNPAHIIRGSIKDNQQDCIRRGRKVNATGEINGQARITREQVLNIRAARNIAPATALATEYGISLSHIYQLWAGRRWSHV